MYVRVYFKERWQNLRLFKNARKEYNFYFYHSYGYIEKNYIILIKKKNTDSIVNQINGIFPKVNNNTEIQPLRSNLLPVLVYISIK